MWMRLSQWLRGDAPPAPAERSDGATGGGSVDAPGLAPLPEGAAAPAAPTTGYDTRGLLGQAIEERNLFDAWERVRANDGAAGVDGQDVDAFAHHALGRLQQLRSEVLKGHYQPQPLKRVGIPKRDGRTRWLAIPSVRDRVLQTAVARVLQPRLEPQFEEASYGYRNGRSVAMAVARIARLRDSGHLHVVDADIDSFFDQIHHDTLLRRLREAVPDAGIQAIVALWLSAVVREGPRSWLLTRGVPQGSPLSPLLSNLYLDDFDEAVLARFPGLVRYADDFVVLVRTPEAAREALALVHQALGDLRLRVSEAKTRITSFEQGFEFLGVRMLGMLMEPAEAAAEPWVMPDAGDARAAARHEARQQAAAAARGLAAQGPDGRAALPRADEPAEGAPQRQLLTAGDPAFDDATDWPALPGTPEPGALEALAAEPVPAPLLQTLYVGQHGAWLLKEGERLTVTRDREVLASVPLGQLDHIAVLANAMVSTALLRHCAERRIGVYLGDGAGGAAATLERGALPDLELFDLQRRRHRHEPFNTHLARAYVEGKLHNAKVVLRRFTRREGREAVDEALRQIDDSLRRLPGAPDTASLRGLEGVAARAYFAATRALLPSGLGFSGRKRRPPQDPVNALLSFGYAVLSANMQCLLRMAGLNIHFGALHATAPGSHALVSDLIEEFRAPVVDAVAFTMLRDGRLGAADFEFDPGAELPCRLRPDARKQYVKALEAKLQSRFIHPRQKKVMDLRRAMQSQVQHYIRVLQRDEPSYLPIKLK